MKNKTLLLLASLVVLTTAARAAQSSNEAKPVALPTYVVTAPRYLPAEQSVNESLNELRQQARVPMVICPDLSALKAQTARPDAQAVAARDAKTVRRIAKS